MSHSEEMFKTSNDSLDCSVISIRRNGIKITTPEEILLVCAPSAVDKVEFCPGGGGGGTWVQFCWVCAAGLSEPLPHYSLFLWPVIDPILVTFWENVIFAIPTKSLSIYFFFLTPKIRKCVTPF